LDVLPIFPSQKVCKITTSIIPNCKQETISGTDLEPCTGYPIHPTAAHVQQYLTDYVERFSLRPRLRLGTAVQKIRFDKEHMIWTLVMSDQGGKVIEEPFNKVIIASGIGNHCNIPAVEGINLFKGQIFDGHAFKK
jgi:cation diffusion facilitator CzcD-associated flavoprotein CzcO